LQVIDEFLHTTQGMTKKKSVLKNHNPHFTATNQTRLEPSLNI